MKPYMLIEGTSKAIEQFEKKVADAMEMGYSLGGELVAHTVESGEARFFQTMVLEDEDDMFDDEEENDEAEED